MLNRSSQLRTYTPLRKVSARKLARAAGRWLVTTLAPRSKKRIAEDRIRYGPTVKGVVMARSGGLCEHPGCFRPATDMHEILPAGRGGSRVDAKNILHTCRPHHVEDHAENNLKSGHQPIIPTPGAIDWWL